MYFEHVQYAVTVRYVSVNIIAHRAYVYLENTKQITCLASCRSWMEIVARNAQPLTPLHFLC